MIQWIPFYLQCLQYLQKGNNVAFSIQQLQRRLDLKFKYLLVSNYFQFLESDKTIIDFKNYSRLFIFNNFELKLHKIKGYN